MKKKVLLFLSMAALCTLFCLAKTTDAKAENGTSDNKIYNLNITVERNYDYAKQVLELVNQERIKAGVDTVKMDEELTEAAMVRAMETTVDYEHGRANLLSMLTLVPDIVLENIGCARETPQIIMDAWMDSEGHRNNILHDRWKSVGIGCIKYKGTYFWVQLFSQKIPAGTIKSGRTTSVETIEVSEKFMHLSSPNLSNDYVQSTTTLSLSQPCKKWDAFYFEPNPSSFTFQSSNPIVATINSSGTISVLKDGTTTITAYYAGTQDVAYSKTINCKVGTGSTTATAKPTSQPADTASANTETVTPTRSFKVNYYCDVVFHKKNGEGKVVKSVKKNTRAKRIRDPKRKGYVFKGWYTSNGKKFNFSKKIRSYTVLYAKWKKK